MPAAAAAGRPSPRTGAGLATTPEAGAFATTTRAMDAGAFTAAAVATAAAAAAAPPPAAQTSGGIQWATRIPKTNGFVSQFGTAGGASPGTPSTFGQSNHGHGRGGGQSTPLGTGVPGKPGGLFGAGAFGGAAASKAAGAATGYASPGFGGGGGGGASMFGGMSSGGGGGGIGGHPQARPPSSASGGGGGGGSFARMDSVFGQTARGGRDREVGWCRLTVSTPVSKAPMASALEATI